MEQSDEAAPTWCCAHTRTQSTHQPVRRRVPNLMCVPRLATATPMCCATRAKHVVWACCSLRKCPPPGRSMQGQKWRKATCQEVKESCKFQTSKQGFVAVFLVPQGLLAPMPTRFQPSSGISGGLRGALPPNPAVRRTSISSVFLSSRV